MDISNLILSDEALNVIDNGAWVDDFPGYPGVGLKVTGLQSDEAIKSLRQKHAQARQESAGERLTDEQLSVCLKEVLHETVLKDWRGLTDNGEPVKYSKEQAKEWIMSKNGERFANLCVVAAQRIDANAQSFVEAVTKN